MRYVCLVWYVLSLCLRWTHPDEPMGLFINHVGMCKKQGGRMVYEAGTDQLRRIRVSTRTVLTLPHAAHAVFRQDVRLFHRHTV
jgi:hypothetical protein